MSESGRKVARPSGWGAQLRAEVLAHPHWPELTDEQRAAVEYYLEIKAAPGLKKGTFPFGTVAAANEVLANMGFPTNIYG